MLQTKRVSFSALNEDRIRQNAAQLMKNDVYPTRFLKKIRFEWERS